MDSYVVCGGVWDEQPVPVPDAHAADDAAAADRSVHHRDHLVKLETNKKRFLRLRTRGTPKRTSLPPYYLTMKAQATTNHSLLKVPTGLTSVSNVE